MQISYCMKIEENTHTHTHIALTIAVRNENMFAHTHTRISSSLRLWVRLVIQFENDSMPCIHTTIRLSASLLSLMIKGVSFVHSLVIISIAHLSALVVCARTFVWFLLSSFLCEFAYTLNWLETVWDRFMEASFFLRKNIDVPSLFPFCEHFSFSVFLLCQIFAVRLSVYKRTGVYTYVCIRLIKIMNINSCHCLSQCEIETAIEWR